MKFKPGDKVRLINIDNLPNRHTNWIKVEKSNPKVGDTFIVSSTESLDNTIFLEGLNYWHEEERFELVESKSEVKILNPTPKIVHDIDTEYLQIIHDNDIEFYQELEGLIKYLASTYGDKYAKADIDTKGVIYSKHLGKGFNIGNAFKYLSRYATTGFKKSENPEDLLKVCHYAIFELVRKTKENE